MATPSKSGSPYDKRVTPDARPGVPLAPMVGPTPGPNPRGPRPSAPPTNVQFPSGTGRKGR